MEEKNPLTPTVQLLLVFFFLGSVAYMLYRPKVWHSSSPLSLNESSIANDVWQWYHTEGLVPLEVQRFEWDHTQILGPNRWGYILFFKGKLVDTLLKNKLLSSTDKQVAYDSPTSREHPTPSWWSPEYQLPSSLGLNILNFSSEVYFQTKGDDVIVYWIRRYP